MTAITGNTYPVKDAIKAMGGRWNADQKSWMVPDEKADDARKLVSGAPIQPREAGGYSYRPTKCRECGARASRYLPIYRSGVCRDCWLGEKEEREMGY